MPADGEEDAVRHVLFNARPASNHCAVAATATYSSPRRRFIRDAPDHVVDGRHHPVSVSVSDCASSSERSIAKDSAHELRCVATHSDRGRSGGPARCATLCMTSFVAPRGTRMVTG
jgi:hypothetical protein